MSAVGLKCQSCGMIYTLGADTKVDTGLPEPSGPNDKFMSKTFLMIRAGGGNENDPDQMWFLPDPHFRDHGQDRPYRPDTLHPPWSLLRPKEREAADLDVARLLFLLSTGVPRHWQCPKCKAVQLYPPASSFVAR